MKKLLFIFIFLFMSTCSAQSSFHDTWNIRDFYERINYYTYNTKATGHYFYGNVRGLDSHMVVFDNDYENILFVAEQNNLIMQIVITDTNEQRLNEKTIASLRVFNANINEYDLKRV